MEADALPALLASHTAQSGAPGTAELGLLMQSAQAHQQLASRSLERLESHAQGLDAIVREEIRRAFIDECGALLEEAGRAADALARVRAAALRHFAAVGLVLAATPAVVALLLLWRLMPSRVELAALRAQRAQLVSGIAQLSAAGGRIQLRHCGRARRLCVRVDLHAQAYGESADYLIVKGY